MKSLSLFLLMVAMTAAGFFSAGCNYNKLHDASSASDKVGSESLTNVDYALVQKTVIGPKCLTCHSNGGGNQGGTNLESLKAVRSLLTRISYRSVERRDMPPSGLGERELTILKNWIDSGAPESVIGPEETTSDSKIEQGPNDWAKIRDRIFLQKCLDCHSGKVPEGGLDLSTLASTRAKGAAIFDRVILKGNMPIAPYPALAPRERRALLKWFDLGMPE
ncbi:hypothetical protein BH10BDE1_BH10BDE1_03740 [soil metagenome]